MPDFPPAKRRKTLTDSIISTAFSAALIGTAVGMTAYRLYAPLITSFIRQANDVCIVGGAIEVNHRTNLFPRTWMLLHHTRKKNGQTIRCAA